MKTLTLVLVLFLASCVYSLLDFSAALITTVAKDPVLNSPYYCALNKNLNVLYCADLDSAVIRMLNISSGIATTIAGTGAYASTGADGTLATLADVNRPRGISYDETRDIIYFAEESHRIRYIKNGKIYHLIGSRIGTAGSANNVLADNSTCLNNPYAIFVDTLTQDVYVADNSNSRVLKYVNATGMVTALNGAGSSFPAVSADDVSGVHYVNGVVYYTEQSRNVVHKLNLTDTTHAIVAGTPNSFGYSGDGGSPTLATLAEPRGVWVDATTNTMFIADQNGAAKCIRMVDLSPGGNISTIVGGPSASGGDGLASLAGMDQPTGVLFDNNTYTLYTVEYGSHSVKKVTNVNIFGATTTSAPTTTTPTTTTVAPTTAAPTTSAPTTAAPTTTTGPTTTAAPTNPPVTTVTTGTITSVVSSGDAAQVPPPVNATSVVLFTSSSVTTTLPITLNSTGTTLSQSTTVIQTTVTFNVTFLPSPVQIAVILSDLDGNQAGNVTVTVTAATTTTVDLGALLADIRRLYPQDFTIRIIRGSTLVLSLATTTSNVPINIESKITATFIIATAVTPTTTVAPTTGQAATTTNPASIAPIPITTKPSLSGAASALYLTSLVLAVLITMF